VEDDEYQIEEEHLFPSTDRRTDRGGKPNNGTFSSRLLQQESQFMG
jgi:hypothetical protein